MITGIPFAQVAANLELDQRVQLLFRRATPEDSYGALGAYLSIILASATAGRRELADIARELYPTRLTEILAAVGLVDDRGWLPDVDFNRYVGRVLDQYELKGEEMRRLGAKGGMRRSQTAARDARGRMLPGGVSEPVPDDQTSSHEPDDASRSPGVSSQEVDEIETKTDTQKQREKSSSLAAARDAAGTAAVARATARTSAEWLAFVLDPDAVPRTVVKEGAARRLSRSAEKVARIGEYFAATVGRPLRPGDGGRLAKLLANHPGKERGLLEDVGALGFDNPLGDPLDYLTSKLSRRSTHGARQPRPGSTGVDYNAMARARGDGQAAQTHA